jgi:hypothetical protein
VASSGVRTGVMVGCGVEVHWLEVGSRSFLEPGVEIPDAASGRRRC